MRIEAYTQVQQLYQSQKVKKSQQAGGVAHASQEQMVQISSLGKDIQTAKAAVASAPDIREELTAPIKAKIDNGTYQVSAESFADKLLQKYEEMR
ncbi:MAG: flagellar biosynthesis anti-sigma factor FlgM [Candidatus Gastranaerophilales bacterium]|nr:flagellar biosynthesis anti-sigma factor FlgM [Candidatus Gastranaerophilales bacterium]